MVSAVSDIAPTGPITTQMLAAVRACLVSVILAAAAMSPAGMASEADPDLVVPVPDHDRPDLFEPYHDPAFDTTVMRIADARWLRASRMGPEYSQLQVWNADQSLMLLGGSRVLETDEFELVHKIAVWPDDEAGGLRWSPTDPMLLYYTSARVRGCKYAALMGYKLTRKRKRIRGKSELINCFPEYGTLDRDASYEELSMDGRFIALVGNRKDGRKEVFAYDLDRNHKHRAYVATGYIDWVSMSPSGRYVIVLWGGGGPGREQGMEAFDLDMNFVGKVHTGTGHSDLIMDEQGDEWVVVTNANNAYLLGDRHYLVKARIPTGVYFDEDGNVDEAATLANRVTVPLLNLNWFISIHISCRNVRQPDWCVVTGEGGRDEWQPYRDEIFLLYLDSKPEAPHVERLVHHRSSMDEYWAIPFATSSPDGSQIVFGSDWHGTSGIDAYLIQLD